MTGIPASTRATKRLADALSIAEHRETLTRLLPISVLAVGAGSATAVGGVAGIGLVIGALVASILLAIGARVGNVFLGTLAAALIGYAFLGRGFAHIGGGPIYFSELLIPLAVLAWMRCAQPGRFSPLIVLVCAFMAWGAIQTIPYLTRYGFDALRDAVTWGYALFALVIAAILQERHLRVATRWYARAIPVFLLWVPAALFIMRVVPLPLSPGADVPILEVKGGDLGVLLAAAGAFVLVGLYGYARGGFGLPEPVLWLLWLAAVGFAGIINRGGLVAAATVGATVLYMRSATRWLMLIFMSLVLIVPVALIDPRLEIGGQEFSVGQVVTNVTSVFGDTDVDDLEGTERFRIAWWGTIVSYTVDGPYFWGGKGYGINLANDDGFQPTADRSLRAPHSVHMEVLARSGVPGLVLWILLQLTFAWSLLRTAHRARVLADPWWVMVIGWAFIHWLATLVNASFDPYLQGPQGGIWFWVMFGVGLASMRMADQAVSAHERESVIQRALPDHDRRRTAEGLI